ncbi:MAG: penicillin-binding transpeptidase domain-containing protein [Pyrinomonadaceae bacterium]
MKLMCPEKRFALAVFSFLLAFGLLTDNISAQNKKKTQAKKSAASAKADAKKKDTRRKDASNSRTAKSNARDKKSNSKSAKNDPKSKKLSAREQARLDSKSKKSSRESKREAAERRRQEAIRREAALAEQRRREAAARAARERFLAFERGLRTETVDNISHDNTSGEDLSIRKTAIDALGNRAGTVVVMESQTGKLLTVVNQDWAIKNGFKPCSTIKLVTGVAGVNENVINNDGDIVGENYSVNLNTALAFSKNPYFQRVGVKMGNAKMIDYARSLGLGQKTGINAEGETPGKLPYGNSNPRIYSHGDDFEVTPLQLAVMVSALSNGGNKVVPHISKPETEKTAYKPHFNGRIDIPQERFQQVLPGMMGAAEFGTAHRGVDAGLGIAGKTGSCIGRGSWVGLFASVAPVENPKYAVVVITRGHGERGKYAAAVAGRIYRELAPKISRDQMKYMALKQRSSTQPIDARTAAAADDEDEDEAIEGDLAASEVRNAASTSQQAVVVEPKKTVVKTASSKPVFSPVVIPYKKDTETAPDTTRSRPRIVRNEK